MDKYPNSVVTVSVVTPTYNRGEVIDRAVQSVLNQSYKNYEIIVVDDASTDNTLEVINSFTDPRIRYLRHEENKGGAAARNTGIKAANGKYIAFLDSDDEWVKTKLERQLHVLNELPEEIGVIASDQVNIHSDGREVIVSSNRDIGHNQKGYQISHAKILKQNPAITSSALVKKECFERVGLFDEELPAHQEWDMWIRISRYYRFYRIREPLVRYYLTPNSIFRNRNGSKRVIEATMRIVDKHYQDMVEHSRLSLSQHLHFIGSLISHRNSSREGAKYFLKAIRVCPWNVRSFFSLLILSLMGSHYSDVVKRLKRIISVL